ncbi:MAG: hypothetical protein EA425_06060 [Puniceicoccaceae bacterium]|nr:MAG: hypothetical protein EA425_06060 [Puniceicoccaceae bacterium]
MVLLGLLAGLLLAGCESRRQQDYTAIIPRFFIEANPRETFSLPVEMPQSGITLAVNPRPFLTEADVANVELVQVDLGLCLLFELTPAAGRDLYRITASNQGRRMVLTLNGMAVGVRMIDQPFSFGQIILFLEVAEQDLPELAVNLRKTVHDIQARIARAS